MSYTNGASSRAVKSILTLSLAKHLHGTPIAPGIEKAWSQVSPHVKGQFENVGFDLVAGADERDAHLKDVENVLRSRHWDGVIFGWCVRGSSKEFTQLFESLVGVVVDVCVRSKGEDTKLIFAEGPHDLVSATLRNFPVEDEE